MSGIIFDTSVYISALREGNLSILEVRRSKHRPSQPLWLSAVVLSELLTGAADSKSRKRLIDLGNEFRSIRRILVPEESDWRAAGEVLAKIGLRYGYETVRKAQMTNDALIAISAGRKGFTVITRNAEDFKAIADFRPFNWELSI